MLFIVILHSHGYIFPFLFCFLLFFSQLFVRLPQTAILLFWISFSGKVRRLEFRLASPLWEPPIFYVNKQAQSSWERCSACNNLESLSIYDTPPQKIPNPLRSCHLCPLSPYQVWIILLSQAVLFLPSGLPALTFFQKWPGVIGIPFPFPLLLRLSRFSCPTLRNLIDGSPPGSPIPGILQARTLEWVAISFSNAQKWKVEVRSLSCVWLFATPQTTAYQAPPSMGFSRQEYWSGVPSPSLAPAAIAWDYPSHLSTSSSSWGRRKGWDDTRNSSNSAQTKLDCGCS